MSRGDLLTEIVLADITPYPRMGRDGQRISHRAWHAESPDRVSCGVACDWQKAWGELKDGIYATQRFRDALEARASAPIRFRNGGAR